MVWESVGSVLSAGMPETNKLQRRPRSSVLPTLFCKSPESVLPINSMEVMLASSEATFSKLLTAVSIKGRFKNISTAYLKGSRIDLRRFQRP